MVIENGGRGFLQYYNNHIYFALIELFPNEKFYIWKFHKVPKNYWNDINNQRLYLDFVAKELNIKTTDDWYTISNEVCEHFLAGKNIKKFLSNFQ